MTDAAQEIRKSNLLTTDLPSPTVTQFNEEDELVTHVYGRKLTAIETEMVSGKEAKKTNCGRIIAVVVVICLIPLQMMLSSTLYVIEDAWIISFQR